MCNSLLAGVFALLWLILRSGPRPSRLSYPCQQAAFSTASLALGAPLVAAVLAARRTLVARLRTRAGVALALAVVVATGAWLGYLARAEAGVQRRMLPPSDYRAQVFHVTDCPPSPVGDRFPGLDSLLQLMGYNGLMFYRSDIVTPLAGPEGIIAADDVVVLKINYQWPDRGGTNTDLLRGLIRRIVDHPDGFNGEVVVCENTQTVSIDNFDRQSNNAEDNSQSPRDVVEAFQDLGHAVSLFDWTLWRERAVEEYSDGDTRYGYVVYDFDISLVGRISYPKFATQYGTMISLRDGVWDPDSDSYDRDRLKFINLPVLKSHHASYGVTACVKNYMGVVTNALSTNSHSAIARGILGAVMAEIRPADLHILDCIWVNADPYDGPWTAYDNATRLDQLVASTDPVAADIWAATNILVPAFLANGHTPPWPHPSADPGNPTSSFRIYLDYSMSHLLARGYEVTNDLDQIDVITWDDHPWPPDYRVGRGRLETP
jgi:hypothetical protein